MGAYTAFSDPQDYVAQQVPSKIPHASLSANNTIIALQLGNVFLLLGGIAVLVCFFSDRVTAKGYLLIIAFADLGHIYSSYVGMGKATSGISKLGMARLGGMLASVHFSS